MIEAVSDRGYEATSVAELSRLAGVSKRTFYEQYDNKEMCFLAAQDNLARCAMRRFLDARSFGADWRSGLGEGIRAVVLAAAEQPKATQLMLVEARHACPAAADRLGRTGLGFERLLAAGGKDTPEVGALPPTVVKAIVCGLERVMRRSICSGAVEDASRLADELAAWALTFVSPAIEKLPGEELSRTDRAAHLWPRIRARAMGERVHMLRVAAEIAATERSSRITPEQITQRAGVSEKAFLDCFESTEACLLDALDLVGVEALTTVGAASRMAGEGLPGAYRGIMALMDQFAGDPLLRWVVLVETFSPDIHAGDRREQLLGRCVEMLAGRLPHSIQPPAVIAEATVGALWGVIQHHVGKGSARLLPGCVAQMLYIALAPVVGPDVAVQAIQDEECALRVAVPVPHAA